MNKYFSILASGFNNRLFYKIITSSHCKNCRGVLRLSAFIFIISFTSCEKVIDINYQEAATKYVIEGEVNNIASQPATVKLSQTKKFDMENTFVGVGGAVVTIQVNNGSVYALTETTTGVYKTTAFTGIPGSTYKLSVTVNGSLFTSVSVMPWQIVTLDTLTVDELSFGGDNTKTIQPDYLDPVGLGNNYRFIEYANGVQVKSVFVQNDAISDGLRISRPLIYRDAHLKSGDIVKVDMMCVDALVYKYWYSLDQAATGSSNSTPANPVTNIAGGALGYFSAHSIRSKTIVIP